jgi:hypothetical protein
MRKSLFKFEKSLLSGEWSTEIKLESGNMRREGNKLVDLKE